MIQEFNKNKSHYAFKRRDTNYVNIIYMNLFIMYVLLTITITIISGYFGDTQKYGLSAKERRINYISIFFIIIFFLVTRYPRENPSRNRDLRSTLFPLFFYS